MKRIIILFVAISIISCKNRVNYDSSTYLTEEDTIREPYKSPIPQKTKYNLTKLYYRVLFNEDHKRLEIDTFSYVEIRDNLLIDKISMDWFLLKINKIDTISGVVNIHIGEESQYEDDPKLYEWGNIYSNRYTYHIKRKDKYFSITNDVIEDDPDAYIEKEKVKDSGLKYYTYEDQVD